MGDEPEALATRLAAHQEAWHPWPKLQGTRGNFMRTIASMVAAIALAFCLSGACFARGGHGHGGSHHSSSHSSRTYLPKSSSDERTSSYTKRNGTHVQSYMHTASDHTRWNNFSTRGNVNPYTGKVGTKSPDKSH